VLRDHCLRHSIPSPRCCAGTFSNPVVLLPPLPANTTWLSLAQGHLLLSQAVASACKGYSASQFATQRKLVVAYQEPGGVPTRTQFALCNSGEHRQVCTGRGVVGQAWSMRVQCHVSAAAAAAAAAHSGAGALTACPDPPCR